jgi:hypothetical protein
LAAAAAANRYEFIEVRVFSIVPSSTARSDATSAYDNCIGITHFNLKLLKVNKTAGTPSASCSCAACTATTSNNQNINLAGRVANIIDDKDVCSWFGECVYGPCLLSYFKSAQRAATRIHWFVASSSGQ